ncbi:hypothetical protein ABTK74_19560, partial [Acinetobacter baumannii]
MMVAAEVIEPVHWKHPDTEPLQSATCQPSTALPCPNHGDAGVISEKWRSGRSIAPAAARAAASNNDRRHLARHHLLRPVTVVQ